MEKMGLSVVREKKIEMKNEGKDGENVYMKDMKIVKDYGENVDI